MGNEYIEQMHKIRTEHMEIIIQKQTHDKINIYLKIKVYVFAHVLCALEVISIYITATI